MRLFRVDNEGTVTAEVKTQQRLAGLYDGVMVARREGDGDYYLDHGNGNVQKLEIRDGDARPFTPDSNFTVPLDDMPHKAWDRSQTEEAVRAPVSQFGGLFGDGDDAQRPANERAWDTSQPAATEF